MKCPNCGFWNRAQFPKCFQCGCPLEGSFDTRRISDNHAEIENMRPLDTTPEEEAPRMNAYADYTAQFPKLSGSRFPSEPEQKYDEKEPDSIAALKREFPIRKAPLHIHSKPMLVLEHENVYSKSPAPPIRSSERSISSPLNAQSFDNAHALVARRAGADMQTRRKEPAVISKSEIRPIYTMKENKNAKNKARVFFKFLFFLALLCAVSLGVYIAYPKVSAFFQSFRNTQKDAGTVNVNFTIAQIEKNDRDAHEIVFLSNQHESVYIQELKTTYLFTAGEARLLLYDDSIVGETPQQEQIKVNLTPVFYMPSGRQEHGSTITYDLTVPSSVITLLYPDSEYATVQTSMTTIKFNVQPKSRVLVNEEDVSDFADTSGNVVHNIDTSRFGDNYVTITVQTPGHTATTKKLTINRPYMDILIELAPTTSLNSTSKTVELRGTTLQGASIRLDTSQSGEAVVESDGSFTVKALMTRIGKNDVVIRASMPGKEDTLYCLTIDYAPKLDEYSKQAWPLDATNFAELIANPTIKVGKIYVGTGIVTNVSEDTLSRYTLKISEEIVVFIQMVEGKKLELGNKYKIYCDFDSMYNGRPLFVGRFYYDQ